MKPTIHELNESARLDLLADASHAEAQAESGPFYPALNVTRETLLRYAAECRAKATRKDTHAAVLQRDPYASRSVDDAGELLCS